MLNLELHSFRWTQRDLYNENNKEKLKLGMEQMRKSKLIVLVIVFLYSLST